MIQLIHFEVEILYGTTYTTACGAANLDTNVTVDDSQVTCTKCLERMSYAQTTRDSRTNHRAQQVSASA